jgi:hypothetical protein
MFISHVTWYLPQPMRLIWRYCYQEWHMERKMYIGQRREFSCFEWSIYRVFLSCSNNKRRPDTPPDTMPAWRLSPRFAEVLQYMTGATEMIVLVITFLKSTKSHKICRSRRKRNTLHIWMLMSSGMWRRVVCLKITTFHRSLILPLSVTQVHFWER